MDSLEELIEKFNEHAIQGDKSHEEWKKAWEDNNKDEPLPDHLKEDFNLPRALATICSEILKIQGELRINQ